MIEAPLRLKARLPAPPLWAIGPLLVGMFAADLHKLAINTASVVTDNPLGWEPVARNADVFVAVSLLILCALNVGRVISVPRIAVTPLVIQGLLAVIVTVALVRHYDEVSSVHYQRYIGGNFTLFAGAFLLCRDERGIRLAWRMWLAAATVMSLLGIWYWLTGISWSSGRAQLVPGTGIRMGYQSGVAFIYLLFAQDRALSLIRLPLVAGVVFAVFVSGSKMALLLTLGVAVLFALRNLTSRQRSAGSQFLLVVFIAACGALTATIILRGDQLGFYNDTFDLDSYRTSCAVRTEVGGGYLRLAMDAPWGGHGISAAYNEALGHRTHSVVQALLVQTGLPGTLLYVVFAVWLAVNGFRMLRRGPSHSPGYDLLVASYIATVFLLAKGETTGDIPGNRELWQFSGLLLACIVLQVRGSPSRVRMRRLRLPWEQVSPRWACCGHSQSRSCSDSPRRHRR